MIEKIDHIAEYIRNNYIFSISDFSPSGEFSCEISYYSKVISFITNDFYIDNKEEMFKKRQCFNKAVDRIRDLIISDVEKLSYINSVLISDNLKVYSNCSYGYYYLDIEIIFK